MVADRCGLEGVIEHLFKVPASRLEEISCPMYSSKEMLTVGFKLDFPYLVASTEFQQPSSGTTVSFEVPRQISCLMQFSAPQTRSFLNNTNRRPFVRLSLSSSFLLSFLPSYSVDAIVLCVIGVMPRTPWKEDNAKSGHSQSDLVQLNRTETAANTRC